MTAYNFIDITGQRFGRLVVLRRDGYRCKQATWHCRCDCGAETSTQGSHLRSGHTLSCGCLGREHAVAASRSSSWKHGHGHGMRSPTYRSWISMKTRCTNPSVPHYHYYGGRGIRVCERWEKFENFLADMGLRPAGTSLDRYPNNSGNYEPGNCRWATPKEQAKNRRPSRRRGLDGQLSYAA